MLTEDQRDALVMERAVTSLRARPDYADLPELTLQLLVIASDKGLRERGVARYLAGER